MTTLQQWIEARDEAAKRGDHVEAGQWQTFINNYQLNANRAARNLGRDPNLNTGRFTMAPTQEEREAAGRTITVPPAPLDDERTPALYSAPPSPPLDGPLVAPANPIRPMAPTGGGSVPRGVNSAGGSARMRVTSAGNTGSAYAGAQERLDRMYENLPSVDIPKPEYGEMPIPPTREKFQPSGWESVIRAGLAMMAAKPGQSGLAVIGEGAKVGLDDWRAQKEKESAQLDREWEQKMTALRHKVDVARSESERQRAIAQLRQAERSLAHDKVKLDTEIRRGMSQEDYQRRSIALQEKTAARAARNPYEMQIEATRKLIQAANPDASPAEIAQKTQEALHGNRMAATEAASQREAAQFRQQLNQQLMAATRALAGMEFASPQERSLARQEVERLKAQWKQAFREQWQDPEEAALQGIPLPPGLQRAR